MDMLGAPYVYGAAGPNTFDDSGLTYWAHKQCGITIPRTGRAQTFGGREGDGSEGDIVCFGSPAYRVGICYSSGKCICIPHPCALVQIMYLRNFPCRKTYRRYY